MTNRVATLASLFMLAAVGVTALTSCESPSLADAAPPEAKTHDHSQHDHGAFESNNALAVDSPYSFRRDIAPMLHQHCGSCHTAGGTGTAAVTMFDANGTASHQTVQTYMGRMLLEIQAGRMPQGKPYSIPEAQFKAFDFWAAAGGPDN